MTPAQLRMARAALKLTVREIEERTGVNKDSISRFEAGREILSGSHQRLEQLFLEAGVIFLAPDDQGREGIKVKIVAGRTSAAKPSAGMRKSRRAGKTRA
jgi:transcriptional regulator with XRE-family HTH domain